MMLSSSSSSSSSSYCYISNLPLQVLQLILSKLPLLTLIQCKQVCKSWNSILSDAYFSKLHLLSQRKDPNPTTIVLIIKGLDLYWLQLQGNAHHCSFTPAAKFETRYQSQHCFLFFINSCKGFLCVYEWNRGDSEYEWNRGDSEYEIVHVMNPVTGEFINLPPIEKGRFLDFMRCGLGFSSKTNQFKVFGTTYLPEIEEKRQYIAQVCTIGGTWRRIKADLPTYGDKYEWHSFNVFLNGSFHWLVVDDGNSAIEIWAFDFDIEVCRPIKLPSSIDEDYNCVWSSIGVFKEETLFFSCFKNYQPDAMEVWVMNEYGVAGSWVKMFVIENLSGLWDVFYPKVIKVMEDGNILILCESNMFLYDPEHKSYRTLDIDGVDWSISLFVHQPSFACLEDIAVDDNVRVFNARSPN